MAVPASLGVPNSRSDAQASVGIQSPLVVVDVANSVVLLSPAVVPAVVVAPASLDVSDSCSDAQAAVGLPSLPDVELDDGFTLVVRSRSGPCAVVLEARCKLSAAYEVLEGDGLGLLSAARALGSPLCSASQWLCELASTPGGYALGGLYGRVSPFCPWSGAVFMLSASCNSVSASLLQ